MKKAFFLRTASGRVVFAILRAKNNGSLSKQGFVDAKVMLGECIESIVNAEWYLNTHKNIMENAIKECWK